MLKKIQNLNEKISALQKQLASFPDGELICTKNQTRFKWYHSINNKYTYIPKSQRSLAEKLALKKYLTFLSNDLSRKKIATEQYLKTYKNVSPDTAQILLEKPGYQELLSPYFKSQNQQILEWQQADFESNPKYPEGLTHKTLSGNMVRSKSEAIIDMLLYTNKIPFRYECALTLGDTTVYPDFTILHPKTGKIYYWEHFGLIEDPDYSWRACNKLHNYIIHGIVPTIQLITTFETLENPLSSEQIMKIIEEYFL